jgi:hypothetical protein
MFCIDSDLTYIPDPKDPKMLVEHIENHDPIIIVARRLSTVSADECFSASEVASELQIPEVEVMRTLERLEESDWITRFESVWSKPATSRTRWVVFEHSTLTAGKRYEVLAIEADSYRILDDADDPVLFDPSCFVILDDSEPIFWTCETGEGGERYCSPPERSRPGFFEKYHDGVKSVHDQFWKDLRERYPVTCSERLS